jgi:hypothetical protein
METLGGTLSYTSSALVVLPQYGLGVPRDSQPKVANIRGGWISELNQSLHILNHLKENAGKERGSSGLHLTAVDL